MSRVAGKDARESKSIAGFTLLELLIAISLIAIILVFIVGSLRFGRRAWEVADRMDETTSLVAAQHYVRDILSEAEPIGTPDGQGRLRLAFQGSQDRVEFVANLEGHTTVAGLHKISLGLLGADSSVDRPRSLVVDLRLFRPAPKDEEQAPPLEQRELVVKVQSLSFRYFGRMTDMEEANWHREWKDAARLPQLIGLSLTFFDQDPRQWPELIVAPQLR